jgi:hypothetical protein
MTMNNEQFVPKEVVAQHLSLPIRKVMELARRRFIRAYPIGSVRNQWRFRLSEVAEDITALTKPTQSTISAASRRARGANPMANKEVRARGRLGLVADIGDDEKSGWLKVGELGLVEKYINNPLSGKPTFGEFCAAYVKDGLPFRKKDGRRKTKGTIET